MNSAKPWQNHNLQSALSNLSTNLGQSLRRLVFTGSAGLKNDSANNAILHAPSTLLPTVFPSDNSIALGATALSSTYSSSSSSSSLKTDTNISKPGKRTASMRAADQIKRRICKYDRQYIHKMGIAAIRVSADGFVWLLNSSVRASDFIMTPDERRGMTMVELNRFRRFCSTATICFSVLAEVDTTHSTPLTHTLTHSHTHSSSHTLHSLTHSTHTLHSLTLTLINSQSINHSLTLSLSRYSPHSPFTAVSLYHCR